MGWLGDASLHTPTHIGLHFYNLTNAADFLGGALPAFELVGKIGRQDEGEGEGTAARGP